MADAAALARALAHYKNDLTAPALELLPTIGSVLEALTRTPDCLLARLSGSGPTCFGLFADEASARKAAASLSAYNPRWWIAAAALLEAPGIQDLSGKYAPSPPETSEM